LYNKNNTLNSTLTGILIQNIITKNQLYINILANFIKTNWNFNMSPKPKLFITCGRPFSGKSTVSKKLSEAIPAARFSYDEIWFERQNSLQSDQATKVDHDSIMNWIIQQTLKILELGQSVIIDNLFDTLDSRESIRKLFGDKGFEVITVYCKISDEVQRERIKRNQIQPTRHQVDPEQINIYNAKFEIPDGENELVVFDVG